MNLKQFITKSECMLLFIYEIEMWLINTAIKFYCRMQVEVSKYTEGVNEKALRPNGLPKSLIRYDGNTIKPFLAVCMILSETSRVIM